MGKGWTIAATFAAKIDRRRLGALAVLILEGVLVSVALPYNYGCRPRTSTNENIPAASVQASNDSDWYAPSPELDQTDRILYPYSVIPGGVRNSVELQNAVAHDDVVARHYSDFDIGKARVTRLSEARSVFVSYRVGSRIFWTKNRVNIPAGETVVTDGEHTARTRCGNRLSAVPVAPVLKEEPSPEAMEIPAGGALVAAPEELPVLPLVAPPASTIVVPEHSAGSIFIPPIVPIFPLGGSPYSPGIPAGTPPPPIVPPPPQTPVSTPEPSDFLMLTTGLACIWLLRRMARA
jgi:hypothetical protein